MSKITKLNIDGGGVAGIFNNEQAVLQQALSGLGIDQLLKENKDELNKKHHEDISRFKETFLKNNAGLLETFVMVILLKKRKQDWCILHRKY